MVPALRSSLRALEFIFAAQEEENKAAGLEEPDEQSATLRTSDSRAGLIRFARVIHGCTGTDLCNQYLIARIGADIAGNGCQKFAQQIVSAIRSLGSNSTEFC